MNASVAVVYLARSADGTDAFRRFAESYREHDAGLQHDLVVIYKGFESSAALEAGRAPFDGLPHLGIELDDSGFDIGSYWQAAQRLAQRHVVFLNTHSTIASANWLKHLHHYGSQEGCGIAGAMGSYESLQETIPYLEAVIAASMTATGQQARQLAKYFDFLLPRFRPDWYAAAPKRQGLADRARAFVRAIVPRQQPNPRAAFGGLRGSALIWPGAPELDIAAFPPFPNPHVRSNGFMVSRERFVGLEGMDFRSKADANLFESGSDSITAQFRRSGLAAIVVGADGQAYSAEDWPKSRTFRLGDQGNLLIADNHTRAFVQMSEPARAAHALMTWGEEGAAGADVPRLGFRFGQGPLQQQAAAGGAAAIMPDRAGER